MKRICILLLVCGLLLMTALPVAAYTDDYAYDDVYAYEDAESYTYEEDASDSDERMPLGTKIVVAIGAGLVIGLVTVLVLRSQLRTVHMQYGAADYIRPNSMKVEVSSDMFLFRRVTKVALPKNDKD